MGLLYQPDGDTIGLVTEDLTQNPMQPQTLVTNCPYCTDIIVKDVEIYGEAKMTLKCPKCQKFVRVEVKQRLEMKAKLLEESKS